MGELRGEVHFAEESLRSEDGGELGVQHLDSDLAVGISLLGEKNLRHPPAPDLALDVVPLGERAPKPLERILHGVL